VLIAAPLRFACTNRPEISSGLCSGMVRILVSPRNKPFDKRLTYSRCSYSREGERSVSRVIFSDVHAGGSPMAAWPTQTHWPGAPEPWILSALFAILSVLDGMRPAAAQPAPSPSPIPTKPPWS
jgi:hypothetical protein